MPRQGFCAESLQVKAPETYPLASAREVKINIEGYAMITWEEFEKVDLRCGTIVAVDDNKKANRPAYVVKVDLGNELGIKTSSARITDLYKKLELIGKQVVCVVNFEPKYIAGVKSEVLICGFYTKDNEVVLAEVIKEGIDNGAKLG